MPLTAPFEPQPSQQPQPQQPKQPQRPTLVGTWLVKLGVSQSPEQSDATNMCSCLGPRGRTSRAPCHPVRLRCLSYVGMLVASRLSSSACCQRRAALAEGRTRRRRRREEGAWSGAGGVFGCGRPCGPAAVLGREGAPDSFLRRSCSCASPTGTQQCKLSRRPLFCNVLTPRTSAAEESGENELIELSEYGKEQILDAIKNGQEVQTCCRRSCDHAGQFDGVELCRNR